ncbi:MAG: hypothetical protein CMQ15_04205 [Gammaproteobacteria bacterium]|jgi:uncharacterized protein YcfL|nr:hypothetical protein [Gammaproteobacteria bacterium]HJN95616.1 hypothetical protein [Gammaproteobacteria bacterium]|tara:strand:+ start:177 stop:455 length:279 start_codon:yes stop_codon:yes gene_type:complete
MRKLVILFLVLLASIAWAADNQPQQQADENAEQLVLDTEVTSEELEAAENDELILGDTEDTEQVDEQDRSSSRFIPTEQISQDLGVSFPVDI